MKFHINGRSCFEISKQEEKLDCGHTIQPYTIYWVLDDFVDDPFRVCDECIVRDDVDGED